MDRRKFYRRLATPRSWSVAMRRLLVVACPIAVPLWMLLLVGSRLAACLGAMAEPAVTFWNDPPRRYHSRYDATGRGGYAGNVIPLTAATPAVEHAA
jgi:hypothetical protein